MYPYLFRPSSTLRRKGRRLARREAARWPINSPMRDLWKRQARNG